MAALTQLSFVVHYVFVLYDTLHCVIYHSILQCVCDVVSVMNDADSLLSFLTAFVFCLR